ncbi:cytochrome P450 [Hoeflea poritis]|uniref:Cytochrome P450 n=1 Tax=Hoeflea poritis TaxID=2993659 RepID=A0ABT4VR59_9HYPH|nr:cytochrome P450 [Hoeflea poritis]MDA4847189.1 cytochrome P450 [Hoeflea poritis]
MLDLHPEDEFFQYLKAGSAPPGFDVYPVFRKLQGRYPVWKSPWGDWYVSSYEAVCHVLMNRDFLQSPPAERGAGSFVHEQTRDLARDFDKWLLFSNPPQHAELRRAFSRAVKGRSLKRLKPVIEDVCGKIVPDSDFGSCEFVDSVARVLPVAVVSRILCFPEEDQQRISDWSDCIRRGFDVGLDSLSHEDVAALEEMMTYFRDLVKSPTWRRVSAQSGLDELAETFDSKTAASNLAMLAFVGHETTVHLLGSMLLSLSEYYDAWQQLKSHPELVKNAVIEALRHQSPVQKICRTAVRPIELAGMRIPEGEMIVLLLGAANRDPARFPNPDRFDVTRRDNRHVAFGIGLHRCLGDNLAVLEAETLLSTLLQRWKSFKVKPSSISWHDNSSLRGLDRLCVEWTA